MTTQFAHEAQSTTVDVANQKILADDLIQKLCSFGNYLFKRYGVMEFSNDGTNTPLFQRQVYDADIYNWKSEQNFLLAQTKYGVGDKVKVFLMPENEGEFPGFTGQITAVHGYPSKIKYDVELKFAGGFNSRIYNVDEVLISPLTK